MCLIGGFGFGADFQRDVDLGAIVELANRFGCALVFIELGIDFVIDARLEPGKTVGSVSTNDVGFYGACLRVGEIDDGVGQRTVSGVEDFAGEQSGLVYFFGIASEQLGGSGEHRR